MARINLLPWRQAERERKNKEFLTLAGAIAAVAALGVLMAMTLLNNTLSNQQAANDYIKQENDRLDKVAEEIATLEQQREEMLSRLKIIQDLQGQRSVPVRVWDDIAKAIESQPMYLVSMKREGNTITISGYADNPNTVSSLVRSLDASPWLDSSGVPNIQSTIEPKGADNRTTKTDRAPLPEDTYIQFTVTTQVKPDVPKKEGENTETGTTPAEGAPTPVAPTDGTTQPPAEQPVAPAAEVAAAPAPQPATPAPTTDAQAQSAPASEPAPAQPAGGQ